MTEQTSNNRPLFLINVLEETAKNKLLHYENPYLLEACLMVGWHLNKPYPPQWNFYHVTTNSGGILPFHLPGLIQRLRQIKSADCEESEISP